MMKYGFSACTAFYFFISTVVAQPFDFNNFQGLKAEGKVPVDFTKLSSAKYNEDVENEGSAQTKKEQKDKQQFLLESNFLMDNILHNGRVIFGDPVTVYLNQMKDIILKNDPESRKQIRIYTLRSSEVNAFTANNGVVLVTTGLVSKTQNEAQLAYILCHEFTHFIKKHPITSYVEGKKMERGDGIYRTLRQDDIDLEKFKYSKELESEADMLGFELFKTTPYALDAVNGAFDVLKYADLPFAQMMFDRTFFNDSLYFIPYEYFLDTLQEINIEDDYDDEEMTHPNIKKRREAVISELNSTEQKGDKKYFILPEDKFYEVRKLCRYDLCEIYVSDVEYPEAFYQAYMLMQTDTGSFFLQKIITQSLYGLSIYANSEVWLDSYTKMQGELQQLYFLFHALPDKELNVLALKYTWSVHKKYPQNKYIMEMAKHLARELSKNGVKESDFFNAESAQKDTNYLKLYQNYLTSLSAYDTMAITPTKPEKLKKIKREPAAGIKDYWKYAFINSKGDKEFSTLFHQQYDEPDQAMNVTLFNRRRPVYHLGADALVVVNPLYMKIDETNKNPVKYEAAEKAKLDLQEKMTACAEELDLELDYLDHNLLDAEETDKFNDLSELNEWLMEQMTHADDDVNIINSNYESIQRMSNQYKSDHFAWFGIVGFTEKEDDWGKLLYGWLGGFYLPFLVSDLVTPDYWTYVFVIVCDAETGQIEMTVYNAVEAKDGDSVQKSNIYYIMQQIKNK